MTMNQNHRHTASGSAFFRLRNGSGGEGRSLSSLWDRFHTGMNFSAFPSLDTLFGTPKNA